MAAEVIVVGGGIAGVACARTLADAGVDVEVRDRGSALGGRICTRLVDGRPVDVGAAYLTVRDPGFGARMADWVARGLARPWTDTFAVLGSNGTRRATRGPMRYAAPAGLRALVADLARGVRVRCGVDVEAVSAGPRVDGDPADAVVLAMPGPQAHDLLDLRLREEQDLVADAESTPTLTLYARWPRRTWAPLDGAFVDGSPLVSFLLDDGWRIGDGTPVLVTHSTPEFAARQIDDPDGAIEPLLAETQRLLGVTGPPRWVRVQRWALARPAQPHSRLFHLGPPMVGLCGDSWGGPRVEAAYLSGIALGRALAARLR